MRKPPIKEDRLITDLRREGQYFIAINLGDIIRRLNEDGSNRLQQYDANRLDEYGDEFTQSDKSAAMRDVGKRLKAFVASHKP